MGLLTQLVTITTPGNANLTSVGAVDWAVWGNAAALTAYDWKSGAGHTIPDPTLIGPGPGVNNYTGDARTLSWTDGTNTPTSSSTNGIYNDAITAGDGLQLVLPADLNVRTVYLYIGGYNLTPVAATVTATLSDGSAPTVTDSTTMVGLPAGSIDAVVALTYQANSPGQTLTVQWFQNTSVNQNVVLNGAAYASVVAAAGGTGDTPQGSSRGLRLGTPLSRLRSQQLDTSAASVTAIGTSSTVESADIVAAAGATATSSSAAVVESADIVAAAGSASTTGSAAILESADFVSGVGVATAGASGSASIVESADAVAGTGATSSAGSAAVVESYDLVAASGNVSTSGTAAVSERYDVVAASGSASSSGSAAITESADAITASGATSNAGSAAIAEAHDLVSASGAVATTATATVLEAHDLVVGAGSTVTPGQGSAAIREASDTVVGVAFTIPPPPALPGSAGGSGKILSAFAVGAVNTVYGYGRVDTTYAVGNMSVSTVYGQGNVNTTYTVGNIYVSWSS